MSKLSYLEVQKTLGRIINPEGHSFIVGNGIYGKPVGKALHFWVNNPDGGVTYAQPGADGGYQVITIPRIVFEGMMLVRPKEEGCE
jgi:hypothetical protein